MPPWQGGNEQPEDIMRRTILFLGFLSAVGLVALSARSSEASGTKYWEGVTGFKDCHFSCGNNQGHDLCTCTTYRLE